MKKTKKVKKHNHVKLARSLFVVGVFLIVVLIGLVLSSSDIFDGSKEVRLFSIMDECSLVMGNLIHQIRDSGDCRIRCINECDIRDMDFDSVEFVLQNSTCHLCDCYCR